MNAIVAEDLVKIYKSRKSEVRALDGVDLVVGEGSVLGLLGPNGAGKTTAVRILATLLRPDAGRATVAGLDVVRDAQELRSVIGLSGQYAAVDDNLTGRENLELVGRLYHLSAPVRKQRAVDILERFELSDASDRMVKTYSGGMRRRLDVGASLDDDVAVFTLSGGRYPSAAFGMPRTACTVATSIVTFAVIFGRSCSSGFATSMITGYVTTF